VLSLSSSARYFLYDQPTDMRYGVYSLAGLVTNKLGRDSLSGDSFIFMGKSANQIRLLQWDTDGFALYIKRLESGTFERPAAGKGQLGAGELMLILQGIGLASVKRRKRFTRIAK
jgi:transposase